MAGQLYSMLPGEKNKEAITYHSQKIKIFNKSIKSKRKNSTEMSRLQRGGGEEVVCGGGKAAAVLEEPSGDATPDRS